MPRAFPVPGTLPRRRARSLPTWPGLLGNLMAVTPGNIAGGTLLVGAVYWLVYLREKG
jgi:formate/nitrite transporter FocA (FNT family)